MTKDVLRDYGFNETAIKVVQVENSLTDYYEQHILFKLLPFDYLTEDLSNFHWTDKDGRSYIRLNNEKRIGNFWAWLTVNTCNAVQDAARRNDILDLLSLMGISLHVVQDFYAHSNWNEKHPRIPGSGYETVTWFDAPTPDGAGLYCAVSGSKCEEKGGHLRHGTYGCGLNKDSYGQKGWDEAYVFAYAATCQWVEAIKRWVKKVKPSVWRHTKQYNYAHDSLDEDWEAAYKVSLWINWEKHDGHWKGKGSGCNEFYAKTAGWTGGADSRFVEQFKVHHIYRKIYNRENTNTTPDSPIPEVPRLELKRRAIIVRTLYAREKGVGMFEAKIDALGSPDFYADVTVDGQLFREAMQLDKSKIYPDWTTIKFVPASKRDVDVKVELWDEDGGLRGPDNICDIHPDKNEKRLKMNFNTKTHWVRCRVKTGYKDYRERINGIIDNSEKAALMCGREPDASEACLQLFVTEKILEKGGGEREKEGWCIYVDNANKQVGSGTKRNPFNSIQSAIAAARSGDIILIKAGNYDEKITFDKTVKVRSIDGAATIGR